MAHFTVSLVELFAALRIGEVFFIQRTFQLITGTNKILDRRGVAQRRDPSGNGAVDWLLIRPQVGKVRIRRLRLIGSRLRHIREVLPTASFRALTQDDGDDHVSTGKKRHQNKQLRYLYW